MPLANRFLSAEAVSSTEEVYPLDVFFCEDCYLSQLTEVIPPEILFREYVYVTSTSDLAVRHADWLADSVVSRFSLTDQDLVVEIASNDGCVLKAFNRLGTTTLGVEPARNIAAIAQEQGIDTLCDFFSSQLAKSIEQNRGPAQVIIGRHVLAHVDALRDFVQGISLLLDQKGIVIIEVPYLIDLLEKVEYDTIYHEHVSYFSVGVLSRLFGFSEMEIFDVQEIGIHGGSILIYAQRSGGAYPQEPIVEHLLQKEKTLRLDTREPYLRFAQSAAKSQQTLTKTLCDLKAAGKRIAGYGAAAKGNTLLNACGINTTIVDYLVDKNPLKHNVYTPGTHIPVYPLEKLSHAPPDYMLILAWNFASEIMQQQVRYKEQGGKFIIPVPEVHIV